MKRGEWSNRAGVYCITNVATGQAYVGKSCHLGDRRRRRFALLRRGKRHNPGLQLSFVAHGPAAFAWKVLEASPDGPAAGWSYMRLYERERYYVELLRPAFNIADPPSPRAPLS
jgi:group I intron endonuclease